MQTVYITGVSRGLGKALAAFYLENGCRVVGIGRTAAISHPHFHFLPCDLASASEVENLKIPIFETEQTAILIHNAGNLGEIKPSVKQSVENSSHVFQVNYLSPVVLTQRFLEMMSVSNCVFISSGAGKRAISGWSQYCASKAAVDMYAQTLQLELSEQGSSSRILSIAPGVVDTDMQAAIRASNPADFSPHANFIALKEEGKLLAPAYVAQKIHEMIQDSSNTEVLLRVE